MLLGYGYVFGLIFTTLLMRFQAAIGLGLGFWFPSLMLGAVTAAGWWMLRRSPGKICSSVAAEVEDSPPIRAWQWVAIVLLLLLVVVRLAGLALEVFWLPLFPWDAWTTWTVRAVVWSHAHDLVPFVSPDLWLEQPNSGVYSIRAWEYPVAVSLLASWPSLAVGGWNETVANLPWVGCVVALALAFYGQARLWKASPVTALLFLWLLVSLPMLDTHVALAGYADLWLATALGLAFFALIHWASGGDWRQLLLALLAASACVLLKWEGAVWVFLFLPALAAAQLQRKRLLVLFVLLTVGVMAVFSAGGLSLELPLLGRFTLSPSVIELPLVGRFPLEPSGSWEPWLEHLIIRNNWHLVPILLVLTLGFAVFLVVRDIGGSSQRAGLVWVLSAIAAIYVLFFLTSASEWARQGTSLNRILLQFMPAFVFWMMTVWAVLLNETVSEPDRSKPPNT
ncbi:MULTISPECIES: hypothetical protein [Thiorhodovibrio]|uniref:hypothetical protein n=1 Tax=Thiorhodovibrio TaxID=61593 RepID=UPI001911CBDB|nr:MULTISPECIES: hypothetical protein [Thiorhodovibrio]MBK5970616.1 hypothetical protein [Thiorhodovibrio winogradskyi]WPL12759.1 hypothetical protein Thiosp_02538 [Thiorhodovibrio litoralis]